LDVEEALRRAGELGRRDRRTVLGVTGPPGAGKSTLAEAVVDAVPGSVLVGMDGFHLAHSALADLGLVEVKGAPRTFDAAGYVALLRRIREQRGETVWAPQFRREVEDAIAGAVPVRPGTRLVVTEGNYLLLPDEPWCRVPELLDEVWYVDAAEELRRRRLAERHRRYGRSEQEAWARTTGSDEANAELVRATRGRADVVVGQVPPTLAE
ncbi:MAG TPA: nucleoside/nucleotide kinase family protein, partial [Segeticoccus sp.]|nr:nucleoside/nucleotide kinase family protein [Segeticoccus sp.]